jgi:hypothetical protein
VESSEPLEVVCVISARRLKLLGLVSMVCLWTLVGRSLDGLPVSRGDALAASVVPFRNRPSYLGNIVLFFGRHAGGNIARRGGQETRGGRFHFPVAVQEGQTVPL